MSTDLLRDRTDLIQQKTAALDYARLLLAQCLKATKGIPVADTLRAQIGVRADRLIKATMPAHDTSSALAQQQLSAPFLGSMRASTVLGQLAGATAAPASTFLPFGTVTRAGFVAENAPIPAAGGTVSRVRLDGTKIAIVVPVAGELIEDPRLLAIFDRLLRRALADGEDEELLGTTAYSANAHPGGLLAGLSPVGGGSPGDLADDFLEAVRACAGGAPVNPYWVLSPLGGTYAQTIDARFQQVSATPGQMGRLLGMPQICSVAAHHRAILLDADGLAFADGGLEVEAGRHASIVQNDAPSAGPATATSMFQTNSVALRCTRWLSWGAIPGSVAYCSLPLGSPVP